MTNRSVAGSMRERPPGSGKWQLRAFVDRDPISGKQRNVYESFRGTKAAAEKALRKLVTRAESGAVTPSTATVGQLLDRWLELATNQRPRTLYENRSKIENRIRPLLGDRKLSKLTPDLLDDAYKRWLDDGLSPSTVRKLHSILHAACRAAVRWGWIDRAPTERATPPSPDEKPITVPTPERLVTLITAAEKSDPVLATAIGLAALTGARRGELVALRWSDVDIEGERIVFARSLTVAGGEHYENATKNNTVRPVALDPVAIEVLRKRWAYMQQLSDEAESPLVGDPYVLSYNANGARPAGPDTFTHRFGQLCRKMEKGAAEERDVKVEQLPPGERWPYRFHDLRHFNVTTQLSAGVDVRTVAGRVGHRQVSVTLNRYSHFMPDRDQAAAGVLGRALTASEGA